MQDRSVSLAVLRPEDVVDRARVGDTIYGIHAVIYSLRIKLPELLESATCRGRRNNLHRFAILYSPVRFKFFC